MTVEQRRAWVAKRDPERVRALDRARYERDKPKRRAAADAYRATPVGAAKVRAAQQAWAKRNRTKRRAQDKVAYALRTGKLMRGPCEVCGAASAQAHHDDYTKPMDVRWLCATHHALVHKRPF